MKNNERGTLVRNEILNFITKYMQENGWSPSAQEIADGIYLSKTTTHYHLEKLREQGKIIYNGVRQIRVVE